MLLQRIRKWSQRGQGIVEYALILAFVVGIAVVALSSNQGLGEKIKSVFNRTGQQLDNHVNSTNPTGGTAGGATGGDGGGG